MTSPGTQIKMHIKRTEINVLCFLSLFALFNKYCYSIEYNSISLEERITIFSTKLGVLSIEHNYLFTSYISHSLLIGILFQVCQGQQFEIKHRQFY